MALSPWEKDIGVGQGRVAAAMTGSYAFQIGSASRGDGYFNIGDYTEVLQGSIEFDSQTILVRADVDVVLMEELPTGYEWELSGWLNSTQKYGRRLRAERRELYLRDIAISTTGALSGPNNTIKFRLGVVAA